MGLNVAERIIIATNKAVPAGVGHSVDDVISALQNTGLFFQTTTSTSTTTTSTTTSTTTTSTSTSTTSSTSTTTTM